MSASPSRYTVRWHIPITRPKGQVPGADLQVGSCEAASASELKLWILARDWPAATIFEVIRKTPKEEAEVRCRLNGIRDWRTSRDPVPLGSDLKLPTSRQTKSLIFKGLLGRALDYAVDNKLIDEVYAETVEATVFSRIAS